MGPTRVLTWDPCPFTSLCLTSNVNRSSYGFHPRCQTRSIRRPDPGKAAKKHPKFQGSKALSFAVDSKSCNMECSLVLEERHGPSFWLLLYLQLRGIETSAGPAGLPGVDCDSSGLPLGEVA